MLKFIIPLILFMVMLVFLGKGLTLDPRDIPSPLLNKPAPDFTLPLLTKPHKTLSKVDMAGKVWLLNVWASWCGSCRVEHPVFNQLAQQNIIPIVGLNYKDDSEAAKQWLAQLGNPYQFSPMDKEGRIGIEYGVYGVPETFIIDKKGVVRYKHTGIMTVDDIKAILPLIAQLQAQT